jgi:hypothetical protein
MHLLPQTAPLFGSAHWPRCCSPSARAADPVFPDTSRIGLVAPAGFTPSTRFPASRTSRRARDPAGRAPADAYRGRRERVHRRGAQGARHDVQLREPLTFKDGKGFFVSGPQESDGQKRYEAVMVANTGGVTASCRCR